MLLSATGRSPTFAVLTNPIEEGTLETDIIAKPLGFQPLVAENLLSLGEEFLVKAGLLYEVTGRLGLFGQGSHGDHGGAGLKLHGVKVAGEPIEKIAPRSKTSQPAAFSCASSCLSSLPFLV